MQLQNTLLLLLLYIVALLSTLPFLRKRRRKNTHESTHKCNTVNIVISDAHVRRADTTHTTRLLVRFTAFTGSNEILFRRGLRERRAPVLPLWQRTGSDATSAEDRKWRVWTEQRRREGVEVDSGQLASSDESVATQRRSLRELFLLLDTQIIQTTTTTRLQETQRWHLTSC